jgi:hypothetical protein
LALQHIVFKGLIPRERLLLPQIMCTNGVWSDSGRP